LQDRLLITSRSQWTMSRHCAVTSRRTVRILRPQQHPAVKRPRKPEFKLQALQSERSARHDTRTFWDKKERVHAIEKIGAQKEQNLAPHVFMPLTFFSAMAFYKEVVEIGEGNL
jgi:hypothetical protein